MPEDTKPSLEELSNARELRQSLKPAFLTFKLHCCTVRETHTYFKGKRKILFNPDPSSPPFRELREIWEGTHSGEMAFLLQIEFERGFFHYRTGIYTHNKTQERYSDWYSNGEVRIAHLDYLMTAKLIKLEEATPVEF